MTAKTTEMKIAQIDRRIERVRRELDQLYEKKKKLQTPTITRKSVLAMALDAGMTPEEMAERLGLLDLI